MKAGAVAGIIGGVVVAAIAAVAIVQRKRSSSSEALPTVLIGDSLAVGLASPLRMAGLPLHSIPVAGTTIDYWLNKGKAALHQALATKPGGVLVVLGTNDALNGDEYAAKASAAAKELVELITSAGGTVFWIGAPTLPSSYGGKTFSQAVLDAIRTAVKALPDTVWIESSGFTIERSADKLHPTGAGYAHWSDLIVDQLVSKFVTPDTVQGDVLSGDQPEPSPRPSPPSIVVIPPGWQRLALKKVPWQVANELQRYAVTVLVQKRPLGDLQPKTIEGKQYGVMTDLHWDDHSDNTWKWHRGMSLLEGITFTQEAIIQAAREGKLEYHWADLLGYDGVQVFEDAARIDGVRVPVSARTTAAIAEILSSSLGANISPTTPLVEDILYDTADLKVRPIPQKVDDPRSVFLFSSAIDDQIKQQTSGRPGWGIVSCVGKSWVLSNMALDHPGRAVNYGMHFPLSTPSTNGPWPSVDGKSKVFQQPGTAHNPDHSDYSQTLRLCKLAPGAQLPSHEPLRATKLWY